MIDDGHGREALLHCSSWRSYRVQAARARPRGQRIAVRSARRRWQAPPRDLSSRVTVNRWMSTRHGGVHGRDLRSRASARQRRERHRPAPTNARASLRSTTDDAGRQPRSRRLPWCRIRERHPRSSPTSTRSPAYGPPPTRKNEPVSDDGTPAIMKRPRPSSPIDFGFGKPQADATCLSPSRARRTRAISR